jgi:hypothetical protein
MLDHDDALAERELAEEMVSYRRNVTGVRNTVFISPKGFTRHGPRLKVAIDPPDAISLYGETVSIDIASGHVVAGAAGPKIDTELLTQIREFIELNRAVLLDYWNYEITTDELQNRLRSR